MQKQQLLRNKKLLWEKMLSSVLLYIILTIDEQDKMKLEVMEI